MSARIPVAAVTSGSVWKVNVSVGERVAEGDTVVVLEAMKMEIPVEAEGAGIIAALHVAEGDVVEADQIVAEVEL
ncbi:acetyl-CoA carboxylase biotin carboxyl carrier protein subunit [Rhodococcus wratislaviensis]|uniref:acetyl-CoA carboxylase biotin carboxyl carrier protein subunit n=1 Tax=Rhodococcus wratislaviensis TaxID=44752 RepID=UPI003514A809